MFGWKPGLDTSIYEISVLYDFRLFELLYKALVLTMISLHLRASAWETGADLANDGRPISLKIGTQSRHVDLYNMPKFQVQRPFFSRVLYISPSGVPRGWFSVQFWPLFNLSFSNAQLISDKTKTSPKSWIQDFGGPKSWIQVFGSPKSWIQDFGVQNLEFRILAVQNLEFRILSFQNLEFKILQL